MKAEEIETLLRSLLVGEHTSLDISFNDHALSYEKASDWILSSWGQEADWISDEERDKAVANNTVWTLRWFPHTPVGSYAVSASSLLAILRYVEKEILR